MNDTSFLLYSPFGLAHEIAFSTRYYWDGMRRGNDPFVIIQKTISGRGTFDYQGKSYNVPEGYAFISIIPEPATYYYPKDAEQPWELSWLNFYGRFSLDLFRDFRERYGPVLPLRANSKAGILYSHLSSGRETPPDPYINSALCYQFLMEWAREIALPLLQEQSPVKIALNLCAARFREPLGVKELANAAGISREHLTRLFTAETGKTPARHLRELRVKAAQELLAEGRIPAKEVAMRCGFPSVRALRSASLAIGGESSALADS